VYFGSETSTFADFGTFQPQGIHGKLDKSSVLKLAMGKSNPGPASKVVPPKSNEKVTEAFEIASLDEEVEMEVERSILIHKIFRFFSNSYL
jgi:hypothetical protein